MSQENTFSGYQTLLIFLLICILFTIVLDFMLLPAMSAILLPKLNLSTDAFGWIVSQNDGGFLLNYPLLCGIVTFIMLTTIGLMYLVYGIVKGESSSATAIVD